MSPYDIAACYAHPRQEAAIPTHPLTTAEVTWAWQQYRRLGEPATLRGLGNQIGCSATRLGRRLRKDYGYAYDLVVQQRLLGCNLLKGPANDA